MRLEGHGGGDVSPTPAEVETLMIARRAKASADRSNYSGTDRTKSNGKLSLREVHPQAPAVHAGTSLATSAPPLVLTRHS